MATIGTNRAARAAIPDLKKGIELLLVAPKNPLLTKTVIEFTVWAEENNWDYETLCALMARFRRSRKFPRGSPHS